MKTLTRQENRLYNTEENKQIAILASVNTGAFDADDSMDELEELADTAGAEVVARVIQNMPLINNASYLGSGKLNEIRDMAEKLGANLLIVDDELTGAQLRNIEDITNLDVVDRTMLILDIFAQRARSNEGKLQVELAQQKYLMPRLLGMGKKLSRLGGGIGTRGPGETKLESDRRHIRRRIEALEQELAEVARRRGDRRQRRKKNDVPTFAIVGYTNAGKSTLLNRLTGAGVYAQDQLFATLDPTARELLLPSGQKIVLVDTVGLLRRLPHQLIRAFESTLEEAAEADFILHVCDLSNPNVTEQKTVAEELLNELGCADIPMLTVYNKCDRVIEAMRPQESENLVCISAKTGENLDKLTAKIEALLASRMREMALLLPYSAGGELEKLRKLGQIHTLDYTEKGIEVTASVPKALEHLFEEYQQ